MNRDIKRCSTLRLSAEKCGEYSVYTLSLVSADGSAIEIFRTECVCGESKDRVFNDLLYELMRLDAFYDIPVSTQIDILYHMVIDQSIEAGL